jgi:MYXO-CTERM domain-containing protein
MKRFPFVLASLAAALVLPAAAAAKGPASASVSGPGLDRPLRFAGNGEWGNNTPLGRLTAEAGFFPAAFGQQPDPMLPARPAGKLGPRLRISYVVPGNGTDRIVQYVYPYARGGAVTYMKPGQPIFDVTTQGGWFRAEGLRRTLVRQGLPARALPAPASNDPSSIALIAGIGIPGALVALGAGAFLARRRRTAAR